MHAFEVWAPQARSVDVKVGDQKFALHGKARGWWSATLAEAGPGTDYGFVLDGQEPPLPDPRTRWQPHGVHGLSRVVDDAAFQWTDATWQAPPLSSALIYELHIGTFTQAGTLVAAEERLDYLKDLGVTYVELMPIANFPGKRGWGYDGVDLYAPYSQYGSPDDLKHFVNACHARGPRSAAGCGVQPLRSGRELPGQSLDRILTEKHTTPWGGAVNFEDSGAQWRCARFLIDNALMWMRDYHFDGLAPGRGACLQ